MSRLSFQPIQGCRIFRCHISIYFVYYCDKSPSLTVTSYHKINAIILQERISGSVPCIIIQEDRFNLSIAQNTVFARILTNLIIVTKFLLSP